MSPNIRDDDVLFVEYIKNTSSSITHDEDDEAHSGMTKSAREFLKTKFGTISRFYSGIVSADAADINGFTRIKAVRAGLAALDKGGWERSYHQRIFHVSFLTSARTIPFVISFLASISSILLASTARLLISNGYVERRQNKTGRRPVMRPTSGLRSSALGFHMGVSSARGPLTMQRAVDSGQCRED